MENMREKLENQCKCSDIYLEFYRKQLIQIRGNNQIKNKRKNL